MMLEFCCSDSSKLGEVNKSRGKDHVRLSLSNCDLEDGRPAFGHLAG